MWSKTHGFSSEHPIVSQHPIQPSVDQVVEQISDLVDPTLLSESDPNVIEPMSYLVNPTLPSESDFHEAVKSIPLSINPTLPLESEVSTSQFFVIVSSKIYEEGGTQFALNEPPSSCRIASFDWNSLVGPHLPSSTPFQIRVQVKH